MKKLLALLLALVMILSLAACGEEEEEDTRRKRSKKSTEDTSEVSEPEETQPADEPVERDYDSPYTEFEELDVAIIDNDYATVTLSDFDEGDWGITCSVEVENKTDTDISVYTSGVAVNGKMVSESFYMDVEDEDSCEDEFSIYDMEDPEDLTRLSMEIRIYDSEEYDFNEKYLVDIYPQGKFAYKAPKPDLDAQDVLVDEKGMYVAIQSYEKDNYNDFYMHYIAVNDTEELLQLSLNTVTVNGFGFYDYGGGGILPDTYQESSVWMYAVEELEELGLGEVTMLDMIVQVTGNDDKMLFDDEVTLYPAGKSKAKEFVYEYEDDDVVVAETMDFKLTQVKVVVDEWDDVAVFFVLENKTGQSLSLNGEEMKINGKESDSWFYCSVDHPVDTYEVLNFYSSELEEMKIDKIESIEMKLEVRNEDYDVIYEDTVKFDVK